MLSLSLSIDVVAQFLVFVYAFSFLLICIFRFSSFVFIAFNPHRFINYFFFMYRFEYSSLSIVTDLVQVGIGELETMFSAVSLNGYMNAILVLRRSV